LFEVHGGLILWDDNADLITGAELFELGSNRGKVAVTGQNQGGIKLICYGIGKQGDGDVYGGFFSSWAW
jgi:hypothetical protein